MNNPITVWAPTRIQQATRTRLIELIRIGGIEWHRKHDPLWRNKTWKDGILVDLEEDSVLETLADFIISNADPDALEETA